jgi:CheY-like chemotaxis protein
MLRINSCTTAFNEFFTMPTADNEEQASLASPIKILLIEDDCISQLVAKMMLQQMGYQVTTTDLGRIALTIYEDFDLIVSDIGLPDIDGIKVCQTIRSGGRKNNIPMIALTAQPQHADTCLAQGFDRFMTKPIEYEIFKQTVSSLLADVHK